MKKNVKKLVLNKHTVQVLNSNKKGQLQTGADTAGSRGACSFGTRCFVCDLAKPLPMRPGV